MITHGEGDETERPGDEKDHHEREPVDGEGNRGANVEYPAGSEERENDALGDQQLIPLTAQPLTESKQYEAERQQHEEQRDEVD